MAALKTQPSDASVQAFIDSMADASRRSQCATLAQMMSKATGEKPVMWGAHMVGFGAYHYQYASGHEGDWFLIGFSPRKSDLSVYIMDGFADHALLLEKLGKHKIGKSCLYLRTLDSVDPGVLDQLIRASVQNMLRMHV